MIEKLVIYIASPYRSDGGEYFTKANREGADEAAAFVWAHDGIALCPPKNDEGLLGLITEAELVAGNLVMLARCDAVMMVGNWQTTTSTRKERDMAINLNIPVCYDFNQLLLLLLGAR